MTRNLIPLSPPQPQPVHRSRARAGQVACLKQIVRELLGLDDDTCTVSVNEVRCAEPGCPDVETVIAIFRPATGPQRLRILKPVSAVKREDLEALS
jgi:hypothetical protein